MYKQTFIDYTNQRIHDFKLLNEYLPGLMNNPDVLSNALSINSHMYDVKSKLEKLFKRELSWHEIDLFSSVISNYLTSQTDPVMKKNNETILHAKARFALKVRKKFCNLLGIDFPEKDEEYIQRQVRSSKNILLSTQSIKHIKVKKCSKCGKILSNNEKNICNKCKDNSDNFPVLGM